MRWFTLFFVLTLPTAVFAKCEPEMIPTWDPEAADFVCKSRGPGVANQPEDHSPQSLRGLTGAIEQSFVYLTKPRELEAVHREGRVNAAVIRYPQLPEPA